MGLGNLVLQVKTSIDADAQTVTSFIASDKYYEICNLMTSCYMLTTEIKAELDKAKSRLTSLIQNTLDANATTEFNTLFCIQDNEEIIQDATRVLFSTE